MLNLKYTIFIDWLPIASSIVYLLYNNYLLSGITNVSLLKIMLALVVLTTDHMWTPINVPWGHVFWHILIGLAIDSAYQDIYLL
jgi:intracellular septation protein A